MLKPISRLRALFPLSIGALAFFVIFAFVLALVKRKTEVDQLVGIMATGDRADAAWAFQMLADASEESLDDLCRYVSSEKPTDVYLLAWTTEGGSSSMITSPQPFSIGEVARYILAAHLNLPPETEKTVLLKTWETMRKNGSAIPVRPRSILFRVPEIRPPSQVKEYSRLALSGDVGGLMSLLDGKSNADAAWALEALKSLDNENLEELFAYTERRERARVTALASQLGGSANPKGFTVGEVARVLLWTRIGKGDSTLWEEDPSPEGIDKLRSAWKEFRAKTPATGERP